MATFPKRQPNCPQCGGSMKEARPQARYCSRQCKLQHDRVQMKMKHRAQREGAGKAVPGQVIVCKHPKCSIRFVKKRSQLYCSKRCLADAKWRERSPNGFGDRCAVYFKPCLNCSTLVTRAGKGGVTYCKICLNFRRRAANARRSHAKRAAGSATMNISDLAARDGERCNICSRKIDLSLSGLAKWGPTIDHILPVSLGGTNDPNNLSLAHRCCNSRRGNREPAQMLLSA